MVSSYINIEENISNNGHNIGSKFLVQFHSTVAFHNTVANVFIKLNNKMSESIKKLRALNS
jgi:hypothetical protein